MAGLTKLSPWWEVTNASAPYGFLSWGRKRARPKRTAADRIAAAAEEGDVTPRAMIQEFEDGEYCYGEVEPGYCNCNPRSQRWSDATLLHKYGVTWNPDLTF